jgi:NAD(P)-dependent dehydrogenase (short-subunit alcohol dehydrogenase family)
VILPLDVSDNTAVDAAADAVGADWGGIDLWVNDAMVSVLAYQSTSPRHLLFGARAPRFAGSPDRWDAAGGPCRRQLMRAARHERLQRPVREGRQYFARSRDGTLSAHYSSSPPQDCTFF